MTNTPEPELDTHSSASVQHYIETGEYLREGEALSVDAPTQEEGKRS